MSTQQNEANGGTPLAEPTGSEIEKHKREFCETFDQIESLPFPVELRNVLQEKHADNFMRKHTEYFPNTKGEARGARQEENHE